MLETRTQAGATGDASPLASEQAISRGSGWQADTLLFAALAGAVLFRILLLIANDFPVNDGALFLEFVKATSATFPSLPTHASYNGLVLPFAYPPLAFWIEALIMKMGFDSLALLRILPILLNIGYVLLFTAVLLKSRRSRLFAALAVLFLSVNPRSFEWLLMGGGLTRGFGSLFLMLTLLAIGTAEGEDRRRTGRFPTVLAGVAVAGAILSHLEWGMLAAGSVVLSRALGSRNLKDFTVSCAIAGATASALVLPWLLFVVGTHGLDPFLAAASSGGWNYGLTFRPVGIASMAVASNPLAVIGGTVLLIRRQWFWIGFILLATFLTPRHAPTPAMLAIAVFGAQGVISAYEMSLRFVRSRKLATGGAAAVIVLLLALNLYRAQLHAPTTFRVLPEEMRQAMAWVAANQPGKRFAIINEQAWQTDSTGEWFPTLASAYSVTTVQGREWNGQYLRYDDLAQRLRSSRTCEELNFNLRPFGKYDFVWAETMKECFETPAYRPVFHNRLVTIYSLALQGPGGTKNRTFNPAAFRDGS